MHDLKHQPPTAYPNVSPRWLAGAAAVVLLAAAVFGWLALCLLYSQGSWQLLYHPAAAITRTPASVGLTYEPIRFAATETGTTRLTGWWLSSPGAQRTVLYLHGADGNLSNTVDSLAALHAVGLAVFAVDYRGYGQSQPARPSEKQLSQDAEWALTWLTQTRHITPRSIVLYGSGLGANLAAELAASHSELAGVVLDQPLQNAMAIVFNDPRSRLVPVHWLVSDRYDLTAATQSLKIPSLWLLPKPGRNQIQSQTPSPTPSTVPPDAYQKLQSQKQSAWLSEPAIADQYFAETFKRWLDDL